VSLKEKRTKIRRNNRKKLALFEKPEGLRVCQVLGLFRGF